MYKGRKIIGLVIVWAFIWGGSVLGAPFEMGSEKGVGVRAEGMGGAFGAIADDPSAISYNPAGLTQIYQIYPNIMYGLLNNEKGSLLFGGIVIPWKSNAQWAISGQLCEDEDVNLKENIYGLTYAFKFNEFFSMGTILKYFIGSQDNEDFNGIGCNLGLLYKLPIKNEDSFSIGITIQDPKTEIKGDGDTKSYVLSPLLKLSTAYRFGNNSVVALDLNNFSVEDAISHNEDYSLHIGMEQWFPLKESRVGLRVGYNNSNEFTTIKGNYTAGLSYKDKSGLGVDYAYLNPEKNDAGEIHKINLKWYPEKELPISSPKEIPVEISSLHRVVLPPEVSPSLLSPPPYLYVTCTPSVFLPEGYPIYATSTTFVIKAEDDTGISEWTLYVYDRSNIIFAKFGGSGPPPIQFSWNGKNHRGDTVLEGNRYYYALKAIDLDGNAAFSTVQRLDIGVMPVAYVSKESASPVSKQEVIITKEVVVTKKMAEKKMKIFFDVGKATLRKESYDILNKIAEMLKKYVDAKVSIAGHTDNQPIHTNEFPSNDSLSWGRAKVIKNYFINTGLIDEDAITIFGYDSTRPADTNDTTEGKQNNRRAEIIISYEETK